MSLAVAVVAALWPLPARRSRSPETLLDGAMPAYDASEFHAVTERAGRDRAWRAGRRTALNDVPVAPALMWIRRAAVGDIRTCAASSPRPLLDGMSAAGSGFVVLAEEAPVEIVVGTRDARIAGRTADRRPRGAPCVIGFRPPCLSQIFARG